MQRIRFFIYWDKIMAKIPFPTISQQQELNSCINDKDIDIKWMTYCSALLDSYLINRVRFHLLLKELWRNIILS